MNSSRDSSPAADSASHIASHPEWPEQQAHPRDPSSPGSWRAPALPSDFRDERMDAPQGAPTLRANGRQPGISPWLFVMATALNTMVAAVLAVIITLGVVRQERAEIQPQEVALASAYSRPALATGGQPA